MPFLIESTTYQGIPEHHVEFTAADLDLIASLSEEKIIRLNTGLGFNLSLIAADGPMIWSVDDNDLRLISEYFENF